MEGSTEERFVNAVLKPHFAALHIYVYARRIQTGWSGTNRSQPAKGGLLKYGKFKSDLLNWVHSDRGRQGVYYSSFIDLYAFPKGSDSPYTPNIQKISDPYQKIKQLEEAIFRNILIPNFIPYVQLHEFEAFLLVNPAQLKLYYPDQEMAINRLVKEIQGLEPERINESPQSAPSKRIIQYLPAYEGQKAQVGPSIAELIGLDTLRQACPHFDEWMKRLEALPLNANAASSPPSS